MARNWDVPAAELEVLRVLWQHGAMTVRQIADILYPGGKAAQYATVQTLLVRLEDKECVKGDKSQRPHLFRAVVNRESLIGYRLRETAEKLCEGSLTPLLLHLLNASEYSDADRLELRTYLEKLRQGKQESDQSP